VIRHPPRFLRVRRPQPTPSRASRLARLHGQSQTECRQNRTERIQSRVPLPRQRTIEGFPAESGLDRQRGHSAHGVGNSEKCNGDSSGITVLQQRLDVDGNVFVSAKVIGGAKGHARRGYAPCGVLDVPAYVPALHCAGSAHADQGEVSLAAGRFCRDQRMTISVGRLGVEPPSDTTQLLTA